MSRQLIVIGLIWNNQCRLVVGKRAEGSVLAGYDEFPGGKCSENESLESAVIRECLEETGLAVQIRSHRLVSQHTYSHGQLDLHFFDCQAADERSPLLRPFDWWTIEEVLAGNFPPANEAILQSLRKSPHPIA